MISSRDEECPLKIIGYWFNEKKCQKFGANDLAEACRKRNMDFRKISLEDDLEMNQKYDVILHKFTALYAPALAGDLKAKTLIRKVEKYISDHPEVCVIDPVLSIRKLLLRVDTGFMLKSLTINEDKIFIPKFALLTRENIEHDLKNGGMAFPVVCKPLVAGGRQDAHDMALVFNKSQLLQSSLPVVAQSFVNHDAVLFKLFLLGTKWFVTTRPSLKNFYAGDFETINFNSHQISKPESCSPLTHLEEESKRVPQADLAIFERIVLLIKTALKSDLLGIDVVIDHKTGRYAVIDVNAFPGYESVPDVMEYLADAIKDRLENPHKICLDLTFIPNLNLDQKYFVQDISKPLENINSRRELQLPLDDFKVNGV